MTTIIITSLSVLLGVCICLTYASEKKLSRERDRADRLQRKFRQLRNLNDTPFIGTVIEQRFSGTCELYGLYSEGKVLLKRFDTDDAEYNLNEAIELRYYIEKELCYD